MTYANEAYLRYERNITNLVNRCKSSDMTYGEMGDSLQCILAAARSDKNMSNEDMFRLFIHYSIECGTKL